MVGFKSKHKYEQAHRFIDLIPEKHESTLAVPNNAVGLLAKMAYEYRRGSTFVVPDSAP